MNLKHTYDDYVNSDMSFNKFKTRRAGDLLEQIAREEDYNILLLSEPSYNINRKHWLTDDADCCAIWLRGRPKRP